MNSQQQNKDRVLCRWYYPFHWNPWENKMVWKEQIFLTFHNSTINVFILDPDFCLSSFPTSIWQISKFSFRKICEKILFIPLSLSLPCLSLLIHHNALIIVILLWRDIMTKVTHKRKPLTEGLLTGCVHYPHGMKHDSRYGYHGVLEQQLRFASWSTGRERPWASQHGLCF